MFKKIFSVMIVIGFIVAVFPQGVTTAQGTPVACGDIVEGEFTEIDQGIRYNIDLNPGDKISISGTVIGDYLYFGFGIFAPSGSIVAGTEISDDIYQDPTYRSGILGERGTYFINAFNYVELANGLPGGRFGIFNLFISCELADGTVIEAGDNLVPSAGGTTDAPSTATTVVNGFAGIPPVDFSNVAKIPMPEAGTISGAITPTGGEIIGYTLNLEPNDVVTLNFSRQSGNLNLGIVVLTEQNFVAFQAVSITSNIILTDFVALVPGEYTIGVFQVNLSPPPAPEPTAFQLELTVSR